MNHSFHIEMIKCTSACLKLLNDCYLFVHFKKLHGHRHMLRSFILFFFLSFLFIQHGLSQCNGLPTDCTGLQSFTVDPLPVNGFYDAGTTVNFCYSMQNYDQCNSNWFHTLDLNFGPGWDLSTFTVISVPNGCDGMGNWDYYNSVTSVSTGQTYGPCFSYDTPSGFAGNVLDGIPGNNFGDNCTVYTWTFCFSIMVNTSSYGQSLSVDATAVGDGSAGSWTSNTCPGAAFNLSNAYSQACFISATGNVTQPTCLNNDGSITMNVTGNIGPVSYLWTPGGQTSSFINGLSAGTYTVTITDTVNCETVHTFDLDFYNPVLVSHSLTDAVCFGYCDGIAEVFPNGGAPPYTINWLPTGNTASFDSALCAGTYFVTVQDADYCTRIDTIVIGSPSDIILTPVSKDVSCFGGHDGWATTVASGGAGVYFFNWQPSGQNSDTAKNLVAGTYTVTATDIRGCLADTSVTIVSPPQIVITPDITPVTCFGYSDGAIATVVMQGVAPYEYFWIDINQAIPDISGMAAGSYSLLVTDDSGCQQLDTFYIPQPDSLSGLLIIKSPSCPDASDGSIAASVTGGTTPYTYIWNNDPSLSFPALDQLSASYFAVQVTDANGCMLFLSDNVMSLPDLQIHAGLDVSIELGESAILNAQVDRFGDFAFAWKPPYNLSDSNAWTTMAFPYHTTTYTVDVTDLVSGCKGSDSVTVIVLPASYVLVPSAFSPNNDGLNDVLFPVTGGLVTVESFKIFNRWGQVVFASATEGWDGNFKGQPEETATYVYDVRYRVQGKEDAYSVSGSVVLIR